MSIITISSIFEDDFDNFCDFCGNVSVSFLIDTTGYEDGLTEYIFRPIWFRYLYAPIKFSNDEKGKEAFLRNFSNQLNEVVFDFYTYCKENIDYFMYQTNPLNEGKPMSKNITTGINPINQNIDQTVDSTSLASGTGAQFISETVYNGVAWHKLVDTYFTPNRKTALLNAFQWLFVSVYSPETKYDDKIEEKRYVQLSFVDDNNNIIDEQKVYPTKSYFTMSEVDIERPQTLEPQNIAKDIEIAGIVGTFVGNTIPNVTVQSDLTQDQIISTPVGYTGMDQVTVEKPLTALPENIKIGVDIGGVTGSYKGPDELQPRINEQSEPYEYENNTITELRRYSFYYDSNITSFKSTSITTLANGSNFQNASNLETVYLPNCTTCYYNNVFNGCIKLKYVTLPLVTSCKDYMFQSCSVLENISLPSLNTSVGQYAFASCGELKTIDLGNATSIGNYAFRYDHKITDIYLHNTTVVTLSTNSFGNVTPVTPPINIHVPSNLISTYQTANYWSTLYNDGKVTFVAL